MEKKKKNDQLRKLCRSENVSLACDRWDQGTAEHSREVGTDCGGRRAWGPRPPATRPPPRGRGSLGHPCPRLGRPVAQVRGLGTRLAGAGRAEHTSSAAAGAMAPLNHVQENVSTPEGTVFRKGGSHMTPASICPSCLRLCGVGHTSTRVAGTVSCCRKPPSRL